MGVVVCRRGLQLRAWSVSEVVISCVINSGSGHAIKEFVQ